MINTKTCRQEFLSILENLYNIENKSIQKNVKNKINKLKTYIEKEYSYNKELPQLSHKFINTLTDDIEKIELLLGNYFLSIYYDLPQEAKFEKLELIKKASDFRKKYEIKREVVPVIKQDYDLSSILNKYIGRFGKEAVNKKKKLFTPDNQSNKKYFDISIKNYSPKVIEKYLCQSLQSDIIFETKNSNKINTQKLIKEIEQIRNGEQDV